MHTEILASCCHLKKRNVLPCCRTFGRAAYQCYWRTHLKNHAIILLAIFGKQKRELKKERRETTTAKMHVHGKKKYALDARMINIFRRRES